MAVPIFLLEKLRGNNLEDYSLGEGGLLQKIFNLLPSHARPNKIGEMISNQKISSDPDIKKVQNQYNFINKIANVLGNGESIFNIGIEMAKNFKIIIEMNELAKPDILGPLSREVFDEMKSIIAAIKEDYGSNRKVEVAGVFSNKKVNISSEYEDMLSLLKSFMPKPTFIANLEDMENDLGNRYNICAELQLIKDYIENNPIEAYELSKESLEEKEKLISKLPLEKNFLNVKIKYLDNLIGSRKAKADAKNRKKKNNKKTDILQERAENLKRSVEEQIKNVDKKITELTSLDVSANIQKFEEIADAQVDQIPNLDISEKLENQQGSVIDSETVAQRGEIKSEQTENLLAQQVNSDLVNIDSLAEPILEDKQSEVLLDENQMEETLKQKIASHEKNINQIEEKIEALKKQQLLDLENKKKEFQELIKKQLEKRDGLVGKLTKEVAENEFEGNIDISFSENVNEILESLKEIQYQSITDRNEKLNEILKTQEDSLKIIKQEKDGLDAQVKSLENIKVQMTNAFANSEFNGAINVINELPLLTQKNKTQIIEIFEKHSSFLNKLGNIFKDAEKEKKEKEDDQNECLQIIDGLIKDRADNIKPFEESLQKIQSEIKDIDEYLKYNLKNNKDLLLIDQQLKSSIESDKSALKDFSEKQDKILKVQEELLVSEKNTLEELKKQQIAEKEAETKAEQAKQQSETEVKEKTNEKANEEAKLHEELTKADLEPNLEEKSSNKDLTLEEYKEKLSEAFNNLETYKEAFSDIINKLPEDLIQEIITAKQVLEILKKIGKPQAEGSKDHKKYDKDHLKDQKQSALFVIEQIVPKMSLEEVIKLNDLVATKHKGAENPYGYIRKETHSARFREYGNTGTWAKVIKTIKSRIRNADVNALKGLKNDKEKKDEAANSILRTQSKHTYGFGKIKKAVFFRPSTVESLIQKKTKNDPNRKLGK